MTQSFKYANPAGLWTVDLGDATVRLGDIGGFAENAFRGANGSSTIDFDDPTSSIGHSGDGLRGLQDFYVIESAAPANDQRIFSGSFAERSYKRGDSVSPSLRTGAARKVSATVVDLNSLLGFERITGTDGKRPRETVGARLTWLLASTYAEFFDNGFVTYPGSPTMDANDYRGQSTGDVLGDCALAVLYNYFLYYDEAAGQVSLWFEDSNVSSDWTSTIALSNVRTDIDSYPGGTIGPNKTFAATCELQRSPASTGSGGYVPYGNGAVLEVSSALEAKYRARVLVAPNANVKTRARAIALATDFIEQNNSENDTLLIDLEMPAAYVNSVRAGQRVPVRFSHLGGMDPFTYDAWTWVRVLRRGVIQREATPDVYQLHLECSPQEGTDGLGTGVDGGEPYFISAQDFSDITAASRTISLSLTHAGAAGHFATVMPPGSCIGAMSVSWVNSGSFTQEIDQYAFMVHTVPGGAVRARLQAQVWGSTNGGVMTNSWAIYAGSTLPVYTDIVPANVIASGEIITSPDGLGVLSASAIPQWVDLEIPILGSGKCVFGFGLDHGSQVSVWGDNDHGVTGVQPRETSFPGPSPAPVGDEGLAATRVDLWRPDVPVTTPDAAVRYRLSFYTR